MRVMPCMVVNNTESYYRNIFFQGEPPRIIASYDRPVARHALLPQLPLERSLPCGPACSTAVRIASPSTPGKEKTGLGWFCGSANVGWAYIRSSNSPARQNDTLACADDITWNIRDRHMVATAIALKEHLKRYGIPTPKIVICEPLPPCF